MSKLIKKMARIKGINPNTAREVIEFLNENYILIDKDNLAANKPKKQAETKIDQLKQHLTKKGYIGNVDALNGKHGFRTNRLSSMIDKLKHQGWVFDTRELRTAKGLYIDYIYTVAINPTLEK